MNRPQGSAASLLLVVCLLVLTVPLRAQDSVFVGDTLRLTVDDAVAISLRNNLSIQAAQKGERAAMYAQRANWSGLIPSVSASAQYTRNILLKPVMFLPPGTPMGGGKIEIGQDHSANAGLSATVPLVAMPIYRNIQGGKIDRRIAEETTRGTRITLVGQVKLAYIGYLLATESARVMDSSLASAQRTLANVENLAKQGITSEYDLIRARVQVGNLKPMQVQAKQGVEIAELQLRTLLGVEGNVGFCLTDSLRGLVGRMQVVEGIEKDPLTSNSQLRLLELQQQRLHRTMQTTRDSYWPTLAAFANYQWQGQGNEFTKDGFRQATMAAVGVQLSFPIFGGLSKLWQTQRLKVSELQLQDQRAYTRQQMESQVLMTRQAMLAAWESMLASEESMKLAERGVSIARTRYNTGAATILELNDAEMALTEASLNYNTAQYNFVKAYVDFMAIQGVEA